MNKKMAVGAGVGVLMGIAVVGGLLTLGVFNNNKTNALTINDEVIFFNQSKTVYLERALRAYYIDAIDDAALIEGIYRGYVYGLDDTYTKYLTADEFNKEKEESVGNYVGTGIRFTWGITNQHLIVTEVIDNSPAAQAGIQVGDKIVKIDGILAMGSNEEIGRAHV